MTKEQIKFIEDFYPEMGKMYCCEKLGLSESKVRYYCSVNKIRINKDSIHFKDFQKRAALGKVGKKRPKQSLIMKEKAKKGLLKSFIECNDEKKLFLSNSTKKWQLENGHPRGFLNKKRSESDKEIISINSKSMWADKSSVVNSKEHRQKLSDNASKQMNQMTGKNMYSRAKKGKVLIGGKEYFYRSSWEPNIACYFEFLKSNGKIKDWFYEVDTFWFDKIKRGVRSYKPDFKIINNDDTFYYEEVKGWLDDKSKTKLNRMRIYFPKIDIRLLGKDRYNEISKMKSIIKGWGAL